MPKSYPRPGPVCAFTVRKVTGRLFIKDSVSSSKQKFNVFWEFFAKIFRVEQDMTPAGEKEKRRCARRAKHAGIVGTGAGVGHAVKRKKEAKKE